MYVGNMLETCTIADILGMLPHVAPLILSKNVIMLSFKDFYPTRLETSKYQLIYAVIPFQNYDHAKLA